MFEVSKKRLVATRKEHTCYACTHLIEKGEQAIHVRGKEDESYIAFHLHVECNKYAVKRNLFVHGFKKGILQNISKAPDFSIATTECPF